MKYFCDIKNKMWIVFLAALISAIAIFPNQSLAQDEGLTESERDQMIQREMDCIESHLKSKDEVSWADVCYSKSQNNQEQDSAYVYAMDSAQGDSEPRHRRNYNPYSGPSHYAPQNSYEYIDSPEIEFRKHQATLGTEISHISYKEPIFKLAEKGIMYGIYGVYAYHPQKDDGLYSEILNIYRLEGKLSFGQVDYSSLPSGEVENIDDYMTEVRILGGKDFFVNPNNVLTPYAGFGFRYLADNGGGKVSTTGAGAYDRISHYYYLPLGVDFNSRLTAGWMWGANVEWDVFLGGTQDSHLSDVNSSVYPDITNDQKRGFGVRGSFKVVKEGDCFNFLIEPFIRYWHIDNSNQSTAVGPSGLVVTGIEPENNSTEFGVKLGVQY